MLFEARKDRIGFAMYNVRFNCHGSFRSFHKKTVVTGETPKSRFTMRIGRQIRPRPPGFLDKFAQPCIDGFGG